jgi:hypothetical protein
MPFKCIIFFKKKKEGQRLLSASNFGFKVSLFLLFKFGNFSAISCVVVVLVKIVKSHVGLLMILRRVVYTTGSRFLIIYWWWGRIGTVCVPDLLQVLQTIEIKNRSS